MDGTEPISLPGLRALIMARIDPALLDERQTWKYWPLLRLHTARRECEPFGLKKWGNLLPTKRFDKRLLWHAQEFLAPLAENPGCRVVKGNRWTNPGYCPPTPFGEYLWPFAVGMVQEILWYEAEFAAGFHWWYSPLRQLEDRKGRDANPFRPGERHGSWDKGYILGHAFRYQPAEVTAWVEAMRAAGPVSA